MQLLYLVILLLLKSVAGGSNLDALLELKKGIKTDPSGKVLASWDFKSIASDGCPQDWYGISCSAGYVTAIALDDMGLVGDFNYLAISGLKMLRNLSIPNNSFSGSISRELGSIRTLERLDLSRNSFNGTMPSELTNLKSLVYVNLSLNNMGGLIPSGFESLAQLKYLDLHSNSFSGDVMLLLAQLGGVLYIDLSCNRFSGSLDLGLGSTDLVSSIRYLNVSHNDLVGQLFAHDGMPYFDNLEVFDATNNHFVGTIPPFNFVVSLQILRLGNNQLTGAIPEGLLLESSMVLSDLDLSHNQLKGPIGNIDSMTLKSLNLSSNQLSGSLPTKVGQCSILDLSNNFLSGNLSRIHSWGNYVEVIDLSSNCLIGSLPNQTTQFLRLTSLKFSNNSLEGVLPPILGTYPELEIVDFSLNHFSGSLLSSFFNSTRLVSLNLSFNNFNGTLPIQGIIAPNLNLGSLDLSHNTLAGSLAPELAMFRNLVSLDLSSNGFEGVIPGDFPNGLGRFNVSYNNLSGPLPKNLQRFPLSSFRPGNSFLILASQTTAGEPELNFRNHGSHTKSTVRIAIITGLVGGLSAITILTIIFCIKFLHQDDTMPASTCDAKKQDHLSTLPIESANEPDNSTRISERQKNLDMAEPIRKPEVISSPLSMTSSATNSPSKLPRPSENSSPLKVCSPDKLSGDLHLFDSSLKFTAEELSYAPAEAIGTSCHGILYRAVVASGHVLAVKWLKEGIAKGKKEFIREVRKLGNIRHPNLVCLQGYYWGPSDHEKLLITSYVNATSLALYLQDKDGRKLPPLSLGQRLRIAADVARCLNYLHNNIAIPHGNLKSSNILIETSDFKALLTDYSLHRIMTSAGTAEQVLNAGALGYRPPEFASTSRPCPSLKSDVYAFGVILLELLTGRNSSEIIPENTEIDLTEWVRLLAAEHRSAECFDLRILDTKDQSLEVLEKTLHVSLKCILPADERPDIKMVFDDISSILLELASSRYAKKTIL